MSNLMIHAERELERIQRTADEDEGGTDEMQREINRSVLDIVGRFAEVGHSGGSAGYTIDLVRRLLSFEPASPLTGADDEWMAVTEELEQNVRCGRVFREKGVAYDVDAVVYRERGGGGFTGWDSARRVSFPYVPHTRSMPAWLRRPERLLARARRQLRP